MPATNQDLDDGGINIDYKTYDVWEQPMDKDGTRTDLNVREAYNIIMQAREEQKKIVLPGMFWDGCDYNKIQLEEKARTKPKKQTPM